MKGKKNMKGVFLAMKKNRMMRAASALLIAVLLTTSAISGTFAKYVTTASATDTARVAKWGVAITANGETFAKEYKTDDSVFTETYSVISTDKVVAPGTEGTMASMTLTGTPEVAARVTYTADLALSSNWTVEDDVYCPLVVKVNDKTINGLACTSLEDFETKVEAAIAAYSQDYAAGTDLSAEAVKDDSLAITWEWPFSTGDANDAKDTWLGNQAAAGNPATVSLTVNTTVTQID